MEKKRFMYVQDNDAGWDKKDFGLPEVYVLAAGTGGSNDEWQRTAQEFLCKQTKDSYCRQASVQYDLKYLHSTTVGMESRRKQPLWKEQNRKSPLCH